MSHVLICGGAGYVGAHAAKCLAERGHQVSVFDNLSTGHRAAVAWGEFLEGDLLDPASLQRAFSTNRIDAVMHFAALSVVGESVRNPYAYYLNNVVGTINLLQAMRVAEVRQIVFSSTAAVYGLPQQSPIEEWQASAPINPYGASKAMVERILADAASAYGLRSVALRYFNAAGADPAAQIGESHTPETHLIPNVLGAAMSGSSVNIFGDDYATPDGTCIRDYVHVNDLAQAHVLALDHLPVHAGAHAFNLGNGNGFSVLQVVDAARRVTGRNIPITRAPRRTGDPRTLVASSDKARDVLGWQPTFIELDSIVETAWRWHRSARY